MYGIEHSNFRVFAYRAVLAIAAFVVSPIVAHRANADAMPNAFPSRGNVPVTQPADVRPADARPEDIPNGDRMTVRDIYRVDIFCQQLQPESVEVAVGGDRRDAIEATIGLFLQQWTGSDTGIAGYRVAVRDREVTIDLRRDPDAERPWSALSTCEQFALFGGLRETIVRGSDWNVATVEFRSLGTTLHF